jgi:hypothetical protein
MKTQFKQTTIQVIFLAEFKTVIHAKRFYLCGQNYNLSFYYN